MEKFLIFIDGADDAAMFPLSGLLGMTVASDATILVNFVNTLGPNATEDKRSFVTLTVTADSELTVFKALADKISQLSGGSSFRDIQTQGASHLVVCDDVNSVFAHPDILSCTISLDA
tara:strand:+ start:140 stop:493 length:354 start_codon:yes stop_codon:yes gene_type:complete